LRAARAMREFLFNSHLIKIARSRELGRRGEIYRPDQLKKREGHCEFYDARKRNFEVRTSADAVRGFTVH